MKEHLQKLKEIRDAAIDLGYQVNNLIKEIDPYHDLPVQPGLPWSGNLLVYASRVDECSALGARLVSRECSECHGGFEFMFKPGWTNHDRAKVQCSCGHVQLVCPDNLTVV